MANYINNNTNDVIIDVKLESDADTAYEDYTGFTGIVIITNTQQVKVLISDMQLCCEVWGIKMVLGELKTTINDKIDYEKIQQFKEALIGKSIHRIRFLPDIKNYEEITCAIPIVISFHDESELNLMIICDHEGYYSHEYFVQWGSYSNKDYI